jgi:uncharacterized protein (TIGR02300 family)
MANSERGTKRTDPDTGKKFYDLNQDPIVSPYTGKSYPRSFFEQLTGKAGPATARKVDDEDETEDEEDIVDAGPEIVSLEDADAEEAGDDIPDVEDVEVEEDLGDDEEDVFLEEDEDEDDALGFDVGSDEER